jgi:hypothetical protein
MAHVFRRFHWCVSFDTVAQRRPGIALLALAGAGLLLVTSMLLLRVKNRPSGGVRRLVSQPPQYCTL